MTNRVKGIFDDNKGIVDDIKGIFDFVLPYSYSAKTNAHKCSYLYSVPNSNFEYIRIPITCTVIIKLPFGSFWVS